MKKIFLVLLVLIFTILGVYAQDAEIKEDTASNAIDASEFVGTAQIAMSNHNYKVTAGDVYSLNYAAGGNVVSYTIPVDSSYKIRISNLAVLDASGKSYLALKKQVEEIVTKNYPMSGVQFVLLNPATFKVTIKGEVHQTTERNAWALTRLSSVLGGVLTNYSSTRDITVTSSNGVSKSYDLFKASRLGELENNPYLRPDDVITINRSERKVSISGAVERPGTYQLLKGENIKELVEYYGGGLTDLADTSRIELYRALNEAFKSGEKVYLKQNHIDENYALLNHDSVYINSFSNLKPVVFVEGALRQGDAGGINLETSTRVDIQFNEGENYGFFVRRISNLFQNNSDLENAYIIRGEEIIPMDLTQILYDANYYSDLYLQAKDILMIPFKQYFVTVAGAVRNPGRYPYIPDRDWEYYIGLAGGFVETQNSRNAITITNVDGKKMKKTDKIAPEATITAKTNSFLHYFNQYAPIITTILSVITTGISFYAITGQ